MKFTPLVILACLCFSAGAAKSQEVVVTEFPLGIAGSVDPDFFKDYYPQLQSLADTLRKYPRTRAIVTGGSDGERFRTNNDANNPALALGRAHALRRLLINEFMVDTAQIVIRTEDVETKGGRYRYASVRIDWELAALSARLVTVEERPPVVREFTERLQIIGDTTESFGLRLSGGLISSPFGGIPMVSFAVTWKRMIFVEGMVGHTFWNSSYLFEDVKLDTRRRLTGGRVTVFPYEDLDIGIVGGWIHIEEISQQYYEYVRLSEGPFLGLRALPFDFLSVMIAYNPSRQRISNIKKSTSENNQFLFSTTVHIGFGGAE